MNRTIQRELRRERDKAARAYVVKRVEAIELLKSIRNSLDVHTKNHDQWGAVGDLGYVCERLYDIAAFIHQEA